jgi:hypothetical protein
MKLVAFHNEVWGEVEFAYATFLVEGAPELHLVTYNPPDGALGFLESRARKFPAIGPALDLFSERPGYCDFWQRHGRAFEERDFDR